MRGQFPYRFKVGGWLPEFHAQKQKDLTVMKIFLLILSVQEFCKKIFKEVRVLSHLIPINATIDDQKTPIWNSSFRHLQISLHERSWVENHIVESFIARIRMPRFPRWVVYLEYTSSIDTSLALRKLTIFSPELGKIETLYIMAWSTRYSQSNQRYPPCTLVRRNQHMTTRLQPDRSMDI